MTAGRSDAAPAYEREPYRTTLTTEVVAKGTDGRKPYLVLADTILYPEGGGQPPDHGTIGEARVVDVQKGDGQVRHYVSGKAPDAGATVDVALDWTRRFDHMQQHTGQHLLSAVAEDRFVWRTTAFHLGPDVSDIELDAPRLTPDDLARLEEEVAREIRAARPVKARRVSLAEYETLPVRTRGLPEGFAGEVRLVEIAGADLNNCGGTHLASTAEIECLKLLATESLRGGTRLFFVTGGRVRRRLHLHEARVAQLRKLLGAPDDGLAAALELRLAQLHAADRRVKELEEEILEAAAGALAGRGERVVSSHYDARDGGFVSRLARVVVERAPHMLGLLTATSGDSHAFVLFAGADVAVDVAALGREIATLLGGKGGGSGRVFQGKAGSLERLADARARLAGV